jgi:hypothetical protein
VGREARSENDPIPVGGPIAPENIAPPSESGEEEATETTVVPDNEEEDHV